MLKKGGGGEKIKGIRVKQKIRNSENSRIHFYRDTFGDKGNDVGFS